MFILHRIVFFFNTIAILALLASYLAPFVTPELSWHIAFLGLAYPAILALNILFIIYWAVFLNIKFIFSLATIVIGWNYIPRFIQFNAIRTTASTENTIRLITFNTKYFGFFENITEEEEGDYLEKIAKVDPDIICFQEIFNGVNMKNHLITSIQKKYNKYYLANIVNQNGLWNVDNIGIISRLPILKKGVVEHDPNSGNYTIYADVHKGNDTIRVITTHLQSIRFEKKQYDAVLNLKDNIDSIEWYQYKKIASKMKHAFLMRSKQVDAIKEFIDKSPYKVIVCGDFNDSPTSYAYRTISGNLKDAFMEAGSGLGRTYVGPMPSLRIDYILGDESFTFYNYYAKSFPFSDHKMVSCTIKIK